MADEGGGDLPRARRELPRPPRRVPSWVADDGPPAGPRTRIQSRPAQPPAGPPPRAGLRYAVPLIVFVLVLGAAAGWLVREQSRGLDLADVRRAVGPSVLRVLATTCEGTGQASGVLLPDGVVLTAASAIRKPVSVAVLTEENKVRAANVIGVTADGAALLRLTGELPTPAARLAPEVPHPAAERAFVGYDQAGEQVTRLAGTAAEPRPLPQVVDANALGAPQVDRHGRVIGLLTGDTLAAATVVGLDRLRALTGPSPALTPEPTVTCPARGPQTPVEPTLDVANTPLAGEVQRALGEYLDALNQHDFVAMFQTYSRRLRQVSDPATDARKHGTSYAFGARIIEVTATDGTDVATARMRFTVLFSPTSAGAGGYKCGRLDIRYRLVREQQRLRIDSAATLGNRPGCDTD